MTTLLKPTAVRARGQVLVLFCMGLFILALSVMVSLAISTRIKERMEQQTLTDVSAYSNAVATARAFNGIAVMNRAMIGQLVAQAGTQALISWSGLYESSLVTEHEALLSIDSHYSGLCGQWWDPVVFAFDKCFCSVALGVRTFMWTRLLAEMATKDLIYPPLELAAKLEVLARAAAAARTYEQQNEVFRDGLLSDKLSNQTLAQRIVNDAQNGSRWNDLSAPSSAAGTSVDEVSGGFQCLSGGAACWENLAAPFAMAEATEGSLGWPFVVSRADPFDLLTRKLRKNVVQGFISMALPPYEIPFLPFTSMPIMYGIDPAEAPDDSGPLFGNGFVVNMVTKDGGTYWSIGMHPNWAVGVEPLALWSDESRLVSYSLFGTSFELAMIEQGAESSPPTTCGLIYTAQQFENNSMKLFGTNITLLPYHIDTFNPTSLPFETTSYPHYVNAVPSVWAFPWFIDYNLVSVDSPGNNYGQPKNIAVIQRDYNARSASPDPWSLPFFYQQGSPSGTTLKTSGLQTASGVDISHAMSVATGVSYYHRRKHWKEPPNFLNPYWRATLVSADVDDGGGGTPTDASKMIRNTGYTTGADAIDQLRAAGYEGMH